MNNSVSVVFAVHNGQNGLRSALDSIKKQTLKKLEVIMVDAASDDDTAKIMKSYSDKRFSYHRADSPDIAAARNFGLSIASGKYVGFGDNNVVFTETLYEGMVDSAEKHDAPLCVSRMASSDVYGRHVFKSTGQLSRRYVTDRFDMDLIWNPSVSNKLFLRSMIEDSNLRFQDFGKALDAAFSLTFAYNCERIACSSRGYTSYIVPVSDEGVAKAEIKNYRNAYDFIVAEVSKAFDKAVEESETDFDRKELERLRVCYIDTLRHKEITVLLYCYYRHFWSLPDERIGKYAEIIQQLTDQLSSKGKTRLFRKNKDIFYDEKLLNSRAAISERPRVSVCVGRCDSRGHLDEKRLLAELDSVYGQTMPSFELLVDSRLRDIFPEKYADFENVSFIEADSISSFKQAALEASRTKYIMFLDGYVLLNPKILMRHYTALVSDKNKYGFSTSPLTRFDGHRTQQYVFSDLAFFGGMRNSRAKDSDAYVLDLFFCNKLFSVEHLRGIHFVFTDNTLFDMYKLYEYTRFKKLSHRGTYFPYSEEDVMSFLKAEQENLPSNCKNIFSKYKWLYFKGVTVKNHVMRLKNPLKKFKNSTIRRIEHTIRWFCYKLPLKDRVFFYTIRANDKLLENSKCVYDALDCDKAVFAKMLPHSLKLMPRLDYYLLTSKVIVTDDYLKYLRSIRLRPEQKVVQIWHAGGAFKRFGLDAPSLISNLEEYKTHSQYSDVIVTSDYVRQFYAHAFGIDVSTVKALGSPRTDVLFDSANRESLKKKLVDKHPLLKDKKVIVYLPTFREEEGVRVDFDPKIDWERLDSELSDDEVFIISRHPVMKKEYIKGKHYSRLKDYTSDPTPELLAAASVIVTDYSSVIFDASLIGCPTVFYCPDFDNYERDFYLEYPDELPGPVVYKAEDLLGAVRETISNPPSELMKTFIEKEMSACDGHSSERVAELVKSYLR